MTHHKPFSEACVRNRDPILAVIRTVFTTPATILEIGSGTGQHAVYFARALPHLTWQTSDLPGQHAAIEAWLNEAQLPNTRRPLALDVSQDPWPVPAVDGVFAANVSHIMSWQEVEKLFRGVGRILNDGSAFCLYGPFNENGRHTCESNRRFDEALRNRNPLMGLRDIAALITVAAGHGLRLEARHAMPANNLTLVWRKVSGND